MQINLTYPERTKRSRWLEKTGKILEWLSLAACIICPIINYYVGGKWWSVVVVWAVYTFWSLVLSPDIVERNMISQTVKFIWKVCILLALIDICLAPGWADFVIPIIGFSGLLFIAIIYMADYNKQRQNAMPMIWLFIFALVFSVAAILGLIKLNWPMMVLGGISSALSILGAIAFHKDLSLELKKRFHRD